MDRYNLSQADLLSIVSLKYARNEALEPPWYGFFGIVLREYMSRVEDKVATLFIPQLPITAEVDDIDIDDADVSGDGAEEDTDDGGYESPTPTRATHVEPFHLPTSTSSRHPELIRSRSTTEEKSTVPEGSESERFSREMSVTEYQRFRSTRIPDFVRRRFYLDDNLNIKACRIDLVIELKRSSSKPGKVKRSLVEAEVQARQQAAHALAEDERLMVVGCIAAVGNVWRYGEVDRRFETGGGIHNADRDPTYTPGSSSGTPPSTEAPLFDWMTPPATRNQGFQRSPAPSPDTPRVLDPTPKVFTDPTSPAQKAWLTDIHDRLNILDTEMAALYI